LSIAPVREASSSDLPPSLRAVSAKLTSEFWSFKVLIVNSHLVGKRYCHDNKPMTLAGKADVFFGQTNLSKKPNRNNKKHRNALSKTQSGYAGDYFAER
jgi:hypothetical protein